MKNKTGNHKSGRRSALKKLAMGSAAILSGGIENFSHVFGSQFTFLNAPNQAEPEDGPNQPIGNPMGIYPGRVVWAWDPKATNEHVTNDYQTRDFFFLPGNYNQEVIGRMFTESIKQLTGMRNVSRSWDALFVYFNEKKHGIKKGYTAGEKIFIRINQTTGRGTLSNEEREAGKYVHPPYDPEATRPQTVACETAPPIVLEILRHLVNECGVSQSDITIGDPQNPIWGFNHDIWAAEFPEVAYADNMFDTFGRTLVASSAGDVLFYSDKMQTDKIYDVIERADYMINVPNLKPHRIAGITITAKNHFGSQSRPRASHLHYALPRTTPGYAQYRVLVDIMGNKYLGKNTLLFVVDGLWGGGSSETGAPVKYFMEPFNNNWSNSIFLSQDQVALDSVCFDFLRNEWNGIHSHDPINNGVENSPHMPGVDDYLHQAADPSNWPEGIIYDPDNSGQPLPSLGVHEHWNNEADKQYSRNLGTGNGIELVSIPDTLVLST